MDSRRLFVSRAGTLLTGTVLAQLVPIALSPILTRIFSAEEFGLFALYSSLATTLGVALGGTYERAILLPSSERSVKSLVQLALLSALLLSVILSATAMFWGAALANLLKRPDAGSILAVVPFGAAAILLLQTSQCLANRYRRSDIMALGQVAASTGTVVAQVALGFVGMHISALVVGYVAGRILGATYVVKALLRRGMIAKSVLAPHLRSLRMVARKYWKFPALQATTNIIDTLSLQAVILVAVPAYSVGDVGQLSLAQRVVGVPMALVGVGVGEVFFETAARRFREKSSATRALWATVVGLTLLSLPVVSLVVLFGPSAFGFVFGEGWRMAGQYSIYLLPAFVARLAIAPALHVFAAANRQEYAAAWRLTYFPIVFSVLYVASRALSFRRFLIVYALVESVRYIVFLALAHQASRPLGDATATVP